MSRTGRRTGSPGRSRNAAAAWTTAEEGQQFHDAAIEAAFLESVAAYQVAPWDGPMALFRPPLLGRWEVAPGRLVDKHRHYLYPDNDWTRCAPGLEVFEVPGDHDSMVLEPNVRVLAARMKRVLTAAEGAGLPARPTAPTRLQEAANRCPNPPF